MGERGVLRTGRREMRKAAAREVENGAHFIVGLV